MCKTDSREHIKSTSSDVLCSMAALGPDSNDKIIKIPSNK